MIRNTVRADKNEVSTIIKIKPKSDLVSMKAGLSELTIALKLVQPMVSV